MVVRPQADSARDISMARSRAVSFFMFSSFCAAGGGCFIYNSLDLAGKQLTGCIGLGNKQSRETFIWWRIPPPLRGDSLAQGRLWVLPRRGKKRHKPSRGRACVSSWRSCLPMFVTTGRFSLVRFLLFGLLRPILFKLLFFRPGVPSQLYPLANQGKQRAQRLKDRL